MLKAIMENQPIGIIRLSELLNFPQHKVRYSLRILEQEGLIKPSPEGAVTTDKLEEFLDYLKSVLTRCRRRSRNSARPSVESAFGSALPMRPTGRARHSRSRGSMRFHHASGDDQG